MTTRWRSICICDPAILAVLLAKMAVSHTQTYLHISIFKNLCIYI